MRLSPRTVRFTLLLITLAAFALRVYQLGDIPPGWSDDELSNVLVIAQKPLSGDFSVYYTDATGLEALYHALSALPLLLFGFNALGIRLLSAILGTLTIPLTYQVARRLFGDRLVALIAAAALASSFWSLIYSRVNLRHISTPVFMLLTFYFFWAGLQAQGERPRPAGGMPNKIRSAVGQHRHFLLAGLFLGVGFYTYFAARGIPLILAVFCVYLALFHRSHFRRNWRGFALMFALAMLIALPLIMTLLREGGSDARIAEVAAPLTEALDGDYRRLQEHVIRTLRMFDGDGDDEFLYNIPGRPVFGLLGAAAFWAGVLMAAGYALSPCLRRGREPEAMNRARGRQLGATFLLLWWLAGITPGFLSIPAGSLGHTIIAQSAAYILMALPILPLQQLASHNRRLRILAPLLGLLLVLAVAWRDVPDYFVTWPARGNVRFLYRADLADVAGYLQDHPTLSEAGITGLLDGPWDRLALRIETGQDPLEEDAGAAGVRWRWFNPKRAILLEIAGAPATVFGGYPVVETVYGELYQNVAGETIGGYALATIEPAYPREESAVCFVNGLCWVGYRYDATNGTLDLVWRVDQPLSLPDIPLLSKPPPPGAYDGARLLVFAQLLDEEGAFLTGDDGLWADPLTIGAGDVFMQQHRLQAVPNGTGTTLLIGLYDPLLEERILTVDGRDSISLELEAPPAE